MRKNILVFILLVSLMVSGTIFIPDCVFAVQTTINKVASEDAWVSNEALTTSYGTGADLQLKNATSPLGEWRPFFKFDLSDIPNDVEIVSATLNIYAGLGASNRTISVYSVDTDTWTEGTNSTNGVNWNDQPAYNTPVLSTITLTSTGGTDSAHRRWQSGLTVTNYIKQQIAANDTTISLMLKAPGSYNNQIYISSSEATSNQPYLSIATQPKAPYVVDRTVFSNADGDMLQLPEEPDLVNCAVQITNNRDSILNAVLIAARYKDNVLYDAAYTPVSVNPTGLPEDFDVELNVPDNTYTVKTFLWNSTQGMEPLSMPVSIDSTQILPVIP